MLLITLLRVITNLEISLLLPFKDKGSHDLLNLLNKRLLKLEKKLINYVIILNNIYLQYFVNKRN